MIRVFFQDKNAKSKLEDLNKGNIVDLTNNPDMTLCAVEGRLRTDQPSVLIVSTDPDSSFVMKTTLDQLVTAVKQLTEEAGTRWNWPAPKGASMFDKAAKKELTNRIEEVINDFET